jgi:hypothetical protein
LVEPRRELPLSVLREIEGENFKQAATTIVIDVAFDRPLPSLAKTARSTGASKYCLEEQLCVHFSLSAAIVPLDPEGERYRE